jgi:hypothetical protein
VVSGQGFEESGSGLATDGLELRLGLWEGFGAE